MKLLSIVAALFASALVAAAPAPVPAPADAEPAVLGYRTPEAKDSQDANT